MSTKRENNQEYKIKIIYIKVVIKYIEINNYRIRIMKESFQIIKFINDYCSYSDEDTSMQSEDIPPMNDPVSATRVLCGALLLPTIASLCGRLFFESINSNFQRTLLVCIA